MTITLDISPCCDSEPPSFMHGERYALPKGLVAGLKQLANFTGNRQVFSAYYENVHFHCDCIFVTNNMTAIKLHFDLVDLPNVSLLPSEIKLISVFGSDPINAFISDENVLFEFVNGGKCQLPRGVVARSLPGMHIAGPAA